MISLSIQSEVIMVDKKVQVSIRMPPELKAYLEQLAKDNHRSFNAEINRILEDEQKRDKTERQTDLFK